GCDISFEMLKKAAERGEIVVQADLDNLPFKDSCFNTVLSFTSLQNLPETKQALKEAKRVCKGTFVLTMLKKSLTEDFYRHLRNIFEIQEVKDIGEDAGFILRSDK
ncbi:MAG: class I SAM-dependent methyltransferase, partial [Candidatus Nanoarchaeia archaeon]